MKPRPWRRQTPMPGPDPAADSRLLKQLGLISGRNLRLCVENERLVDALNVRDADFVQLRMRAEAAENRAGQLDALLDGAGKRVAELELQVKALLARNDAEAVGT